MKYNLQQSGAIVEQTGEHVRIMKRSVILFLLLEVGESVFHYFSTLFSDFPIFYTVVNLLIDSDCEFLD